MTLLTYNLNQATLPEPTLSLLWLGGLLFVPVNDIQCRLALRRCSQVLESIFRDQDIVFDANASDGVVILQ